MKKTALTVILIILFAPIILAAKKPDLVVTEVKVIDSSSPEGKEKIVYIIKNRGDATAPASTSLLNISSSDDKTAGISRKSAIPALPPNASFRAEVDYQLAAKKRYLIKATADYKKQVAESNPANNRNEVRFSIGLGK